VNVLLVDDDDTFRMLLARELRRHGFTVSEAGSGADALDQAAAGELDVAVLDLSLKDLSGIDVLKRLRRDWPEVPVIMLTANGTIDSAIEAMKHGAYDFLLKPAPLEAVELALKRAFERRQLGEENERLRDGLQARSRAPEFVGHGPRYEALLRFIAKVASSDSTVLVRGETGTGKEVVASAIHLMSRRRDRPFVVVDCAMLNDNLLQSELFGHEKGAFTGAERTRHGLFEAANGGTVFLDEVGDVSPALQAGLLRVLETSTFRRLGGSREVRVDVRLIAATNRDLEHLMALGRFRPDLFFRLNAIHVSIAPLRERREEIPHLIQHFTNRHNGRGGALKVFSPAAIDALTSYDWPGNIRELRHAVEYALVIADGDEAGKADLPPQVARASARPPPAASGPIQTLAALERRHIADVLAATNGHRVRAATALGISERGLYRKIREYGLDEFVSPDDQHGS
jgi:DNA-binding NtrC family response regulator